MRDYNDDRKWPVLMEATETRLAWIEAPTHADAVRYANQDYDYFSNAESIDGSGISAAIPDKWEHQNLFGKHGTQAQPHGPAPRCTTCGVWHHGRPEMAHDFECPVYRAGRVPYKNPPRVPEHVAAMAEMLTALAEPRGGVVEVDGYRLTLTITPQTRAEWATWMRLCNSDPATVRTLATYAHGRGNVGADRRNSVDVTLVGLGVPQLPELVTA